MPEFCEYCGSGPTCAVCGRDEILSALRNLVDCDFPEHDEDYGRTCSLYDPQGCALCVAREAVERTAAIPSVIVS